MEYTKDITLGVHYEKGYNEKKKSWTSNIIYAVKKHKFIMATLISAIIFISIDVILITNFFKILNLM